MSKPFPTDNPFLAGNGAPLNFEGECPDLVIEGEVPPELNGTYYRNGANPQFAPRGGYHLFDGDGMIHAFLIEDGRVGYRNRWVRTERFLLERQAGEALFGSMVDPSSAHPSVVGKSSNGANTNVIWHGDKLLALWEAGLPTELDPVTLETRGLWDFDGELTRQLDAAVATQLGLEAIDGKGPGIMTAHPKIDPKTGDMHFFGYSAMPPYLVYNHVSADGKMLRSVEVDPPFPAMMHDFMITEEHIIFPVFPGVFDFEAMAAGSGMLSWQPERGSHIGVMPRDGGGSDVKWYQTDPCYVFHVANAYVRDGKIITDLVRFPELPLLGDTAPTGPPTLWRWSIDLAGGGIKQEPFDGLACEFPRIDERFMGSAYRYTWAPCFSPSGATGLGFNGIARYDVETGESKLHESRAGSVMGEAIFVPRAENAGEGDGFILVIAYRDDEKRSDLLILDAQNIEDEPLATVQVPVRIPSGFHGNWRPRL